MSLRHLQRHQSFQHTAFRVATLAAVVALIFVLPHVQTVCASVELLPGVDPCQLSIGLRLAFSHMSCQSAARLPLLLRWTTAFTLIAILPLIDPQRLTTVFSPIDPPPRP